MPNHIDAVEIALRLACAILAGAALGMDRQAQGHAAGLRTTILVCASAALVMVEANLLLTETHLTKELGFTTFDVLRLPLGLLSGVGFLGAGAIIHRKGSVKGVTTAATIWFVTVLGLCIGSGHMVLGLIGAGVALVVLLALGQIEESFPQRTSADLTVGANAEQLPEDELRARLAAEGLRVGAWRVAYEGPSAYTVEAVIHRKACKADARQPPPTVQALARTPGVAKVAWRNRAE